MSDLTRAVLLNGAESRANTVFSPLSLKVATALLANAVSTEERRWIEETGIGDISDAALLADWNLPLALANGVWYQTGLGTPTMEYAEVLERVFRTVPLPIDFGASSDAAGAINAYTSDATNGMIPQIVTEQMLREALAVLLNTALLQASWASRFDESNTHKGAFQGIESPVDLMHKSARLPYVGSRHYQSVQLDRNDGGAVQIVLPRPGIDLASVVVNVDGLLAERHYSEKVNLTLPRVAVSGSTDCGELLGIEMATLPGLGIIESSLIAIHQAATVRWNEVGVEAAAATVVRATRSISMAEEVVVDRPFAFFVRESDGTISFAGTVFNPLG